jgi:hypothetical protein
MELPSGIEIPLDALSTEHLVTLQLDDDLSGTHLHGPIIAGAGF